MPKMPLSGFLIAGGILTALYLSRAARGALKRSITVTGSEASDFGHPGVFTPIGPQDRPIEIVEPQGATPHREGGPFDQRRWEEFYREFPEVGPGSQPLDPLLRGG